jgi:pimeloyl-ACP methyl ester carboxylesterase
MIETLDVDLPHGIRLSCRASGRAGAPVLMFLHGFPEAAFVWDELLMHFADRYRCVAPNLRGYERSSAPADVEGYRAKHIQADIVALIEHFGGTLDALVAHDWGGAIAWNLAVREPRRLTRLVIVNSPHPATFLRGLQHDPRQQAASAYMNFLRRPDAERLLAQNDYARLWPFLEGRAGSARPAARWLTDALRDRYRAVWNAGLTGALNYYRASPLYPPTPQDQAVMQLQFPPELVTVRIPTHVVWAEDDTALLPGLLDGLEAFVPRLTLARIPQASHWIVHEQPARVAREIERALATA